MLKKIVSKTKSILEKMGKTVRTSISALVAAYAVMPTASVLAGATTPSYITPLNNLKTIMISLVVAAGVIVLIYGVVKFAISFQKMDQNGEHQAIYTIIAGAVMIGVSAVVSALTA